VDEAFLSFICITDRRGQNRLDIKHMDFAFSILFTISNNIKLTLYHKKISASRESLESILNHLPIGVFINDALTREILYINESMSEQGINLSRLMPESSLASRGFGKWEVQHGGQNWYKLISAPLRWSDGRMANITSLIDITSDKKNEALIRNMADSDHLTGLSNRRKFARDFEEFIGSAVSGYIIFFDLNDFKDINDTMGHHLGDELLMEIGRMLKESTLTKGKAYRQGGDEFVLISRGGEAEMWDIVEFLLTRFSEEWVLDSGRVFCGASIGISSYPTDSKVAGELFNYADMAMYKAKENRSTNAVFYDNGKLTEEGSGLKSC
jgi:diguanylate cyclase (GGDEF)-like protein